MNTYLNQLFNFEGKVAVITGAGGHLCSEMSRALAKAGCSVAVLDLRREKAKAIEDEIRSLGYDKVMSLAIDVAKKEDHISALKTILSKFSKIDILINGAGINGSTPFFEIDFKE